MRIENNPNYQTFKQIKLSKGKARIVNKLQKQYRINKSEDILSEVVNLFSPHIEKEAELIDKSRYSVQDHKQNMFLKLIETFSKIKVVNDPSYYIIESLNSLKPHNTLIKQFPKSCPVNKLKSLKVDDRYDFGETPEELVQKLVKTTPDLKERESVILQRYINGESSSDLGKKFGITSKRVNQIVRKCIHKIKMQHNSKYRIEYEKMKAQQKSK